MLIASTSMAWSGISATIIPSTTHIISNTQQNNHSSKHNRCLTPNSLPTNTSCTPISSTFCLQLQRLLSLCISSLIIIILRRVYLHLEFVNPDFSTPYGITFNLLSVVIVISMLLSHLIRSSTTNNTYPTHHHRLLVSFPFPTLTPIPMPPTPNELDTFTTR